MKTCGVMQRQKAQNLKLVRMVLPNEAKLFVALSIFRRGGWAWTNLTSLQNREGLCGHRNDTPEEEGLVLRSMSDVLEDEGGLKKALATASWKVMNLFCIVQGTLHPGFFEKET